MRITWFPPLKLYLLWLLYCICTIFVIWKLPRVLKSIIHEKSGQQYFPRCLYLNLYICFQDPLLKTTFSIERVCQNSGSTNNKASLFMHKIWKGINVLSSLSYRIFQSDRNEILNKFNLKFFKRDILYSFSFLCYSFFLQIFYCFSDIFLISLVFFHIKQKIPNK